MPHRLPILAIILSVLGLIPFIVCGLGAVAPNTITSLPAAQALIVYGAVVLSFLGAVHWGFTLATENDPAERPRLLLGVAPAVAGWAAAAISIYAVEPLLGIALIIGLLLLAAAIEWRMHKRGWVPGGYITMRIALTGLVAAILITVLVVRTIGGHLIF
jgi:hypothetical protein